jgi:hypothetical protein
MTVNRLDQAAPREAPARAASVWWLRRLLPLLMFVACVLISNAVLGSNEVPPETPPPPSPPTLGWPSSPVVPAGTVGTLAGSGTVGADGQYHYTLPIEIPPGRAGMQPALALAYSSGAGNGLVGVGWQLTGLSAIKQCPRTFATDGTAAGVALDGSDVLCLDGVRLIDISSESSPHTSYRTEDESFARISRKTSNSGGDYFEVWTKEGGILTYSIQTPGEASLGLPSLHAEWTGWLLSSAQDRSGNTVSYSWSVNSSREAQITRITYTGRLRTGEIGQRFVLFQYEGRPDVIVDTIPGTDTYGIDFSTTTRLKSIECYAPSPLARSGTASTTSVTPALAWAYVLHYDPSVSTGRSILTSVTRTGALGGREYAKVFSWSHDGSHTDGQIEYNPLSPSSIPFSSFDSFNPLPVDVDGDGRDELLTEDGNGDIRLTWSPSLSPLVLSKSLSGLSSATLVDARFGDLDGDGIPEIIAPDHDSDSTGSRYYRIYRWDQASKDYFDATPSGWSELYVAGNDPYPQENPLYLVDVDGDGLPDLIKADHDPADPYVDPDRPSLANQPAGLVFDWSIRRNVGGVLGAKVTFIQPAALGSPVNILSVPTSASPFGAFATSDGSTAAVLWGMNIWVGFGPYDWSTFIPPNTNNVSPKHYTTYVARLASALERVGPWDGSVDISADIGIPFCAMGFGGLFNPCNVNPQGNGANASVYSYSKTATAPVPLQGAAFLEGQHLCAIGNFDGSGVAERYCFDPIQDFALDHPIADQNSVLSINATWKTDVPHWRVRVADLDGDGRDDLIAYHLTSNDVPDSAFRVWIDAVGQRRIDTLPRIPLIVGNFNGDGKADMIGGTPAELAAGTASVALGNTASRDLLVEIGDEGAPTSTYFVDYAQVWAPPTGPACTYPVHCVHEALNVVSRHSLYQGADSGQFQTRIYGYDEPRYDLRGHGFLGFAEIREWDPERPAETITLYDNVNSTNGVFVAFLPRHTLSYVPTQEMSLADLSAREPRATNVRVMQRTAYYDVMSLNGGKTYFRHPTTWSTSETEATAMLDVSPYVRRHFSNFGQPTFLRQRSGAYEFDGFGNPTHVTSATIGGVSTDTSYIYEYRISDWLLGLVHSAHTVVASPTSTPPARNVYYTYDTNGDLADVQTEFYATDPAIPETTHLSRNADGLVTAITQFALGELPRGSYTEYDPDEGIFPRRTWNDLGHTTLSLYHPTFGKVSAAIDPNGAAAEVVYGCSSVPDAVHRGFCGPPDGSETTLCNTTTSV